MPHPTPQLQAGRQVERIREILIGRQMETVEQRLDRLEKSIKPMPVEPSAGIFEQKLTEIREQHEETLCRLRDEIDADRLRQLDETRRLAQQIQTIARSRNHSEEEARLAAEHRMAAWFSQWQVGLNQNLQQREDYLITELRAELDRMRSWIRTELAAKPNPQPDVARLRGALEQLAAVTRTITENLPQGSNPPAP
ncbi:hypothetical protein [Haloferula sp.]|uniref:hypothetical protein n=1 Tax=Haloferula sp. TaxID=2497595 RepID=UPI003C715C62